MKLYNATAVTLANLLDATNAVNVAAKDASQLLICNVTQSGTTAVYEQMGNAYNSTLEATPVIWRLMGINAEGTASVGAASWTIADGATTDFPQRIEVVVA